jgi:hypothetical protein
MPGERLSQADQMNYARNSGVGYGAAIRDRMAQNQGLYGPNLYLADQPQYSGEDYARVRASQSPALPRVGGKYTDGTPVVGSRGPGVNAAGLTPSQALQASRDATRADAMSGDPQTARGLLTQRAMGRSAARQQRIAERNAPPQQMGMLEQLAMRDPRNAMALMEMNQRGQQFNQQGLLARERLSSDEKVAMRNADIQEQHYGVLDKQTDAAAAARGNPDALKWAETANNERAVEMELRGKGDTEGADAAARRAARADAMAMRSNSLITNTPQVTAQPGGRKPLTPFERTQLDPFKSDPEAVVAELQRQGFSGNALNVELNKIYGSWLGTWNRTAESPRGTGGLTQVDRTGKASRTLIGVLADDLKQTSWRDIFFGPNRQQKYGQNR